MGIYERKQREKKKRKKEIINAARKVFSNKGFRAATMEEIAYEAELSPGTLYLYFKNKEELHTILSIEILKRLADKIQKVVRRDISVEEKIDNFQDVFIDVYEYDSNILINLFHLQSGETLKNLSDEVLKQIKAHSALAHGAIIDVIRQGIDQGVFIDEHPVALADVLWASYSGIVLWVDSKRLLNNQKAFVKPTLKTAFKIISKGLKKK
ncbi:MAG: TetR/AcrR family transcriptional regulator [Desulfobacula sp.]|uniref:TetR/AcrR family transcriptional regulator n=1 Tax=Desulfobacula sp. TaxID=2593537 RepID=UPI0025BBD2D1|nr:TetR/AcrR family transcriptional regulator [Desulfobacula sp.]MCD4721088.1 TetR/AcrR family transcriptional regulator [Desulfobacula sp.]